MTWRGWLQGATVNFNQAAARIKSQPAEGGWCVGGGVCVLLWLFAPLQLKVGARFTLLLKAEEYRWSRRAESLNYRRSVDALMIGILKNASDCAEGQTHAFRPHPRVNTLFEIRGNGRVQPPDASERKREVTRFKHTRPWRGLRCLRRDLTT